MLKKFFYGVSVVFHPLLMPLLGALIVIGFTHMALLPQQAKNAILLIIGVSTFVFPLSVLPLLYYQGLIKSFTLENQKERLMPMFIISVFYYLSYYVLNKFGAPDLFQHFSMATFVGILVSSVISIFYKISTHMIGLGGILGLISILQAYYGIDLNGVLITCILISGLTGTARLYLEHHTQREVFTGFLLGYILTFGTMMVMQ